MMIQTRYSSQLCMNGFVVMRVYSENLNTGNVYDQIHNHQYIKTFNLIKRHQLFLLILTILLVHTMLVTEKTYMKE